jgi:hypothetical protein
VWPESLQDLWTLAHYQNPKTQSSHSKRFDTLAEARLASGCDEENPESSEDTAGSEQTEKAAKAPIQELQLIAMSLTSEINDKHLVINDVLGQGGFGTVRQWGSFDRLQ